MRTAWLCQSSELKSLVQRSLPSNIKNKEEKAENGANEDKSQNVPRDGGTDSEVKDISAPTAISTNGADKPQETGDAKDALLASDETEHCAEELTELNASTGTSQIAAEEPQESDDIKHASLFSNETEYENFPEYVEVESKGTEIHESRVSRTNAADEPPESDDAKDALLPSDETEHLNCSEELHEFHAPTVTSKIAADEPRESSDIKDASRFPNEAEHENLSGYVESEETGHDLQKSCEIIPVKSENLQNDANVEKEKEKVRVGRRTFDVIDVKRDGNCLFRCLSLYFYKTESAHVEIRQRIVDFTTDNWKKVESTLAATSVLRKYKNAEHYASTMGVCGEYGTDYEVGVFVQIYKVTVTVYRKHPLTGTVTKKTTLPSGTASNEILNIMFSGQALFGHWQLLKDANKETSALKGAKSAVQHTLRNSDLPYQSHFEDDTEAAYDGVNSSNVPTNGHVSEVTRNGGQRSTQAESDKKGAVYSSKKTSSIIYKFNDSGDERYIADDSDSEDSDEEDNRKFVDQKPEKKTNKTKKKYSVDLGVYNVPSTCFKDEYGLLDYEKGRESLRRLMKQFNCTCTLSFRQSVRENKRGDVIFYAACVRKHEQPYRFAVDQLKGSIAVVSIKSTHEMKAVHEDYDAQFFKQLRGEKRREFQENAAAGGISVIMSKNIENTNKNGKEFVYDGHMQDLIRYDVAYKAVSEMRCRDRTQLQSDDLSDLMGLWVEEHREPDPFLRHVALPLTAITYTKEDLLAFRGQRSSLVLHLDATGSICRMPQGVRTKRVFIYSLVAKHEHEVVKLANMITSEHGVVSQSQFLKQYKYFAMAEGQWPLAKAVCTDWTWASFHSILLEWNSMTIGRYLEITYQYCENKNRVPADLILLKVCYAHFINTVRRTIDQKFPELKENKHVKNVIEDIIALICISRDLKRVDLLFKYLCQLLLSKKSSSAKKSILKIKYVTQKKKDELESVKESDVETDEEENELKNVSDVGASSAIYRNSPFYLRYNKILVNVQEELDAPRQDEAEGDSEDEELSDNEDEGESDSKDQEESESEDEPEWDIEDEAIGKIHTMRRNSLITCCANGCRFLAYGAPWI